MKTFDGNHDMNTTTAVSNVIPFRSAELLLVNCDGQPFVPMKPVVDGMGLDWKSQHEKLSGGRFKSVMVIIPTTGSDGKTYEMSCLPLRKLAGWLMSIHASKVRPELRDGVVAYQNECDDALWAYWNEGVATRNDSRTAASVLSTTIGTDGFHCLAAVLDGKLRSFSGGAKRAAKNHIWQQVHRAFSVVRAEDIPADQMGAARNFIASYAVLEGEFIAKPANDGITLNREEARSLYHVLYNIERIQRLRDPIYSAASSLQSENLLTIFTHLYECEPNSRALKRPKAELDRMFKVAG